MTFSAVVNQLLLSILVGGVYAIFAVGLSLSAGVLRLVNLAHGDMIVAAAYFSFWLTSEAGVAVLPSIAITLGVAFLTGIALQVILFQHVKDELLPRLMVTFGLSVVIQNGLMLAFGANQHQISVGNLATASVSIADGIVVGQLQLLMFVSAVVLIATLEFVLHRTEIGAEIRAVAENLDTARLVGLSTRRSMSIAMGIVGLTMAVAGIFMGVWSNFDPGFGPLYLLTAFEVVVLGGLGSLWGMLVAGVLIAVAQGIGAQFDASWQALAGHLAFMTIFMMRPNGLFSSAVTR